MPIKFGSPEAQAIHDYDHDVSRHDAPPLPSFDEWIADAEDLLWRIRKQPGLPVGFCNEIDDLLACRMSARW